MSKSLPEVLRRNLREALRQRCLADAADVLSRLQKEDPLHPATRGLELEFYLASNRLSEANTLARQLCNLFPNSGRIFYLGGKAAYRVKDYPEAESRFRESQRLYPHWQTQQWLGKTLTQIGRFDEAEALLIKVQPQNPWALLDLGWLHERRGDLDAALKAYETFLASHPGDPMAKEQRIRIRAKMLEPEALIEEVGALEELGEPVPAALLPEYVQRLFETGQGPRARQEILSCMEKMEARVANRVAWICYRAQAYDLACSLFLRNLGSNLGNFKYLRALESAAVKGGRVAPVLDAYRGFLDQAPQLHGHIRTLVNKEKPHRGTADERR